MERKSGVLLHISSLWGDYSCGAFGKAGKEFIDFLAKCGFSYWQTLPFCLPDDFNSPYSSYSAFSVNPNFIDLEQLKEVGLVTREELEEAEQESPYKCEFTRLKKERFELLSKAANRFGSEKALNEFFKKYPHTENFCHFMASKSKNDNKAFWEWQNDDEDPQVLNTWKFICYTFMYQWKQLKDYANSKGISIIGDIPIYVSLDSSDVWESPQLFKLDNQRRPLCVAGVPPDNYSEDGQLWGNPIYDWKKMKETNFQWWRDRITFNCDFFDAIRIDHFRGFDTYYTCKPDAKNARDGVWNKGPGIALINALKEAAGDKLLLAEDLGGEFTESVINLVKKSGFPGMCLIEFADPNQTDNKHLPHNYITNCVAYTGTHDNNTLLSYIWSLSDEERWKFLSYCGFTGQNWDSKDAYFSVIRTLLACCADTVIFPLQDLLYYGSDTRMNTPGVAEGNWAWRVTKAQLNTIDTGKLRFYNKIYGRCDYNNTYYSQNNK